MRATLCSGTLWPKASSSRAPKGSAWEGMSLEKDKFYFLSDIIYLFRCIKEKNSAKYVFKKMKKIQQISSFINKDSDKDKHFTVIHSSFAKNTKIGTFFKL